MTIYDRCSMCNDIANYALSINAKMIGHFRPSEPVDETMSGYFCKLHFVERLRSYAIELSGQVEKGK